MTIEFLITSLIVVVSPGTGVLFTLATGLSRGIARQRRRRLRLHPRHRPAHGGGDHRPRGAPARQRARLRGRQISRRRLSALHGVGDAPRARGAARSSRRRPPRSALQVTVTAILINILNPKLSIFFLAFLPQFVSADETAAARRSMLAPQRRLHGDDLRRLRRLRAVRGRGPRPRHLASAGAHLDAPHLRRRLRRARRRARVRRPLTRWWPTARRALMKGGECRCRWRRPPSGYVDKPEGPVETSRLHARLSLDCALRRPSRRRRRRPPPPLRRLSLRAMPAAGNSCSRQSLEWSPSCSWGRLPASGSSGQAIARAGSPAAATRLPKNWGFRIRTPAAIRPKCSGRPGVVEDFSGSLR